MVSTPPPDIEALRPWIGRSEHAEDLVTPALAQRFGATFDRDGAPPREGDIAPPLIHWCLPSPAAATAGLDRDGHAPRGGFLPPVPLPRRMWAGGRLQFLAPLRVGDTVRRHSRIADISVKQGRSGQLCFVVVEHVVSTDGGVAIRERQDIVYREAASGGGEGPPPGARSEAQGAHCEAGRADAALLFRYSALTFTAHRIHYDRDYAREEEGYGGLVVHGPLQATMLMEMACRLRGSAPGLFEFRGERPLLEGPFTLNADAGEGTMSLWVLDGEGRRTMSASAQGNAPWPPPIPE